MDYIIVNKAQLKGSGLEQYWEELQCLSETKKVEVSNLLRKVCDFYYLGINEVKSKGRKQEFFKARMVFCFLARNVFGKLSKDKETNISLTYLGDLLNRDHATVIHSIKTFRATYETDPIFRLEIKKFITKYYGEAMWKGVSSTSLKTGMRIIN